MEGVAEQKKRCFIRDLWARMLPALLSSGTQAGGSCCGGAGGSLMSLGSSPTLHLPRVQGGVKAACPLVQGDCHSSVTRDIAACPARAGSSPGAAVTADMSPPER